MTAPIHYESSGVDLDAEKRRKNVCDEEWECARSYSQAEVAWEEAKARRKHVTTKR